MSRGIGNAVSSLPLVASTVVQDMDAYDQLPGPIRQALRAAPVNIAAGPLLDWWLEGEDDCVTRCQTILDTIRHATKGTV